MENQDPLDEQFLEQTKDKSQDVSAGQQQLQQIQATLRDNQSLLLGVLSGFGASLVGAVIWATITVATGFKIGLIAIGIGFLVGFCVRLFGKGNGIVFGIAGAALSLFGCIFGNYLSVIGIIANQQGTVTLKLLGL